MMIIRYFRTCQVIRRSSTLDQINALQFSHGANSLQAFSSVLELMKSLVLEKKTEAVKSSFDRISQLASSLLKEEQQKSARMLVEFAVMLDNHSNYELAAKHFTLAHEIYMKNYFVHEVDAFSTCIEAANMHCKLREAGKADELLTRMLPKIKSLKNNRIKGIYYEALGRVKELLGNSNSALGYLNTSKDLLADLPETDQGIIALLISCLSLISEIHSKLKAPLQAKDHLKAAVYILLQQKEVFFLPLINLHFKIALHCFELKEYDEIFTLLDHTIEIGLSSTMEMKKHLLADFLEAFSNEIFQRGDVKTSIKVLERKAEFFETHLKNDSKQIMECHREIAYRSLMVKDYKNSVLAAEKTLEACLKLEGFEDLVNCYDLLAEIYFKIGDIEIVNEYIVLIDEVLKKNNSDNYTIFQCLIKSRMSVDEKLFDEAKKWGLRHLMLNKKLGLPDQEIFSYLNLSQIYVFASDFNEALTYSHAALDIAKKFHGEKSSQCKQIQNSIEEIIKQQHEHKVKK